MAHNMPGAAEKRPDNAPSAPAGRSRPPVLPAALAEVLPHAPTPLFYLASNPRRWQCIDGEWLPLLLSIRVDIGVNGCDKQGGMDEAWNMARKRGHTVLPWDVEGPGTSYIMEADCAGGKYRHTRWETPRAEGGLALPSEVDEAGYREFLRFLVRDGHVRRPDAALLEATHQERQAALVQHLRQQTSPGLGPIIEVQEAKLENMKKATTKLRKGAAHAAPAVP